MAVSVKITGVKEVVSALRREGEKVRRQIPGAVSEEAAALLAKAIPAVPVGLGRLVATGRVVEARTAGDKTEAAVAFGDASTPHAVAVHEYPEHSPPSWEGVPVQFTPAGAGPKYLERPLMEQASGMAARLGGKIHL